MYAVGQMMQSGSDGGKPKSVWYKKLCEQEADVACPKRPGFPLGGAPIEAGSVGMSG